MGSDRASLGAPHEKEQDALDQHLADETGSPGAQGGPDRAFTRPHHGPGQQQVRDVGARDQQHQSNRAEHQHQCTVRSRIRHRVRFVERGDVEPEVPIGVRILTLKSGSDRVELGSRVRDRDARLEPREHVEVVISTVV